MISVNKNNIKKICIDDFATKRRETYGTVMIDIDTHRIVDMINSREYDDIVTWLKTFPNIEVVSRDGSITYSNAIKDSHPGAIQVSDRFHLLKNLTDYCKKFLMNYLKLKVEIEAEVQDIEKKSPIKENNKQLTLIEKIYEAKKLVEDGTTNTKICKVLNMDIRTLKKYINMSEKELKASLNISAREFIHNNNVAKKEQLIFMVREMHQKGFSKSAISRELGIHRTTVTNYLDSNVSSISGNYGTTKNNTLLSPYHEHINQLLLEGYTFSKIEQSIKAKGYTGSSSTIRMYATRMRKLNKEAVKEATNENVEFIERSLLIKLLYKPLKKIKKLSESQLNKVLSSYPLFDKIYKLVLEFKDILKASNPDNLNLWIKEAKQLEINEINSFINGINRDIDAVKNAITYSYSNGLAEGSVNKIKVIKRIMYRRCNFSTLRSKVLLLERS
jgi:transposase